MPDACKIIFIILTLSLFAHSGSGGLNDLNVNIEELPLGTSKNYALNNTVLYIIKLLNLSDSIESVPPRIFIKCEDCREYHPLLVVVSQNKGVMSWELPIVIQSNDYSSIYKNTERTLCPFDIMNSTNSSLSEHTDIADQNITHPVIVSLATSSKTNVSVEIYVNLETNFVLELDVNKTIEVTPSTPSFYLFEFPSDNVNSVLLHVTSEDDTCLIVSVQNVSCPVFDLEENVQYRGKIQTVTRQGGFTVTRESFPNGFYIVLIVSSSDKYCSSMLLSGSRERTKNVVMTVSKNSVDYLLPIGSTVAVIAIFCTAMFTISYFLVKRQMQDAPDLDDDFLNSEFEPTTSVSHTFPYTGPVTPVAVTPGNDTLSIRTDSSLDETDFDLVNDIEFDKNIFRMKGFLYVCDLARKNQSVLKKKSELYFWNLLTVGIFYFLPVFQLVFRDQYEGNESGKADLCYYNFLCSHPIWVFSDFNHVFSNIGYITLGTLFIFLTGMKERAYKLKIHSDKKLFRYYGIPQHFGIFYSMGAALIFEGIMSSCYHLCPNHYNFQFDTSFMYVICALCMIKIYQTRHPDINASAYATFSLLAVVIALGMFGVFVNNLIFWIMFTIVHLSTCIYLSLQIYYMGRWKSESVNFLRMLKELRPCRNCNLRFFMPMFPSRLLLLVLANACNWGLAVCSFVYEFKNFSSYLLAIFMINLMLYTTFYIIMKFICKEKLPLQSVVYILLAVVCWSAALYFFFNKTISWRLTPAMSKLFNQKCRLMNFYDNHDIWHFISAAAMFFSFMVLLTLDDDLIYVQRSKIVVF